MLRPLLQTVGERMYRSQYGKQLAGLDWHVVTQAGRDLVEAEPLTFNEIGARLQERWPDYDAHALSMIIRTNLPLVQITPRGIWGMSHQATHTTVEAWSGTSVDPSPSLEWMVRRYLAAYGPASVMDIQAWCGLTKLKGRCRTSSPRIDRVPQSGRQGTLRPSRCASSRSRYSGPGSLSGRVRQRAALVHRTQPDRPRCLSLATLFGQRHHRRRNSGRRHYRLNLEIVREKNRATLEINVLNENAPANKLEIEEEGWRLLNWAAPEADGKDIRWGEMIEKRIRTAP